MAPFQPEYILFWLALLLAPSDAAQITVSGPGLNAAWTRQDAAWSYFLDRSLWKVEGDLIVTTLPGKPAEEHPLGMGMGDQQAVKLLRNNDWRKTPELKLGPTSSVVKKDNTFVFTLEHGAATEKQYVIRYVTVRKVVGLSFHIAPNPPGAERKPTWPKFVGDTTQDFAAAAVKELAAKGPAAARPGDGKFQWFELSPDVPPREFLTGQHQQKKYILLCAQPPDALLPKAEGDDAWSVESVAIERDPPGLRLNLSLDTRGGKLFADLTGSNLRNCLAAVVNGRVVILPTIQSQIGRQLAISGRFTEQELADLAAAIQGFGPLPAPAAAPQAPASAPPPRAPVQPAPASPAKK